MNYEAQLLVQTTFVALLEDIYVGYDDVKELHNSHRTNVVIVVVIIIICLKETNWHYHRIVTNLDSVLQRSLFSSSFTARGGAPLLAGLC